jgi:hypothetical protein
MSKIVMRACVFVIALFSLSACKSSTSNTETASAASAKDDGGMRVLDSGDRPRSALRYRISEGTTTTSTTTFVLTTFAASEQRAAVTVLPGLRLDIVSGPAQPTDRGVRFNVDVVKAEAVIPKGFDEELAQQLREGATVADNIGGWVEIDDRGNMLAGEFNEQTKRADVPVRLLRMIVNTRETLTRVRLPEDKVGLGARWETRQEIHAYGFRVSQVNTYTLVDRAGNEVMLNVTVQQFAKPQTIEFPEEGIEISVVSMTAQAEGQIILDLDGLETDASATGKAEDKLLVKTAEGTETIEITEEFEVQVANTSGLKEE